jgi:DeoR/GlpR family transcriptional regulator of sugar metabolism
MVDFIFIGDGFLFGVERRSRIMTLLNEKRSLLVPDLANMFNVTEETIRRDFKELEKKGVLIRTHGGAVLPDDVKFEAPLEMREGINAEGKITIGKRAAEMVDDNDTIFLDASTAALYMARNIKNKKGLTVITNAERILMELSDVPDITLISTGGILRKNSLSCVGRYTENTIKNYFGNKLFFSCKGFSPKRGLTDSNEQESEVRKTMMKSVEKVIFLCDHTKFDKTGIVQTASIDDIDYLITDADLPVKWEDEVEDFKNKIIKA